MSFKAVRNVIIDNGCVDIFTKLLKSNKGNIDIQRHIFATLANVILDISLLKSKILDNTFLLFTIVEGIGKVEWNGFI